MNNKNNQLELDSATRGSRALRGLKVVVLLLGIGAAGGCRGDADAPSSQVLADDAPSRQYERFGYYSAGAPYDKNFRFKDIAATGMASRLTVLAYAFGDIDPTNLTCSIKPGMGGGGSASTYDKPFDADSSVDGVADLPADAVPDHGGSLRGDFNQLKKLKTQYPHLKVLISLGGPVDSKSFSDIAASDASRQKFVASCIDLYIKGNLPPSHGSGGPGSAAGIFDGFDIAWQWPASSSPADKANHALLLQELRRQLDQHAGGQPHLLTALLPADPAKIAAGIDIGAVFAALDFGNVQSYDFHGPWEPTQTNHLAQLFPSPGDPAPVSARFSGYAAIKAYTSAGISPSRLTLGLPLYGYGWTGVCEGTLEGLYQEASGVASGPTKPGVAPVKDLLRQFAPTQLGSGGQVNGGGKDLFHDPATFASYGYDGSTFWSFDDAMVIELKASYIQGAGLRGAMLWSLDGDDGTLVRVLDEALNAPAGN